MIEFNLLPDVKIEYIKAERTKRAVFTISVIAMGATILIVSFLFLTVNVWQKKSINDLTADIKKETQRLPEVDELNRILTVQNQLMVLPDLHDSKPVVNRVPLFIGQVTPTNATISSLEVQFSEKTLTITGNAESLDVVNTFVDALKFTEFTSQSMKDKKPAFSNVVMTSFNRTSENASYTIDLSFDELIFDTTQEITLVVPNIVTTRSILEQPNLFKEGEQ